MDDVDVLKRFLSYPLDSAEEVFAQFKTIDGSIFREKSADGKERFLYAEGERERKILLVAHADTVRDYFYKKKRSAHAVVEENGILKAVDERGKPQLLGSDDRAGAAMLWLLKDAGHSLLLTDGEEGSRMGSKWLMKENRDIARRINQNHQFMLQLDRRSGNEFKCYRVGSREFRAYIKEQTGFIEPEVGAMTDICSLCEDICGANISVGYYDNHTEHETLNLKEWTNALEILRRMLASDELPRFELRKKGFWGRARIGVTEFLGV